ncbi:hypothetical protein [Methylophaga sp.]|uniref:hypothetical protein n=1 Tax=Methylophaga sp. TaxID=2024840 RepID=UPI002720F241|nr:hypothetical protein [Methylophaga sp.]MDO8828416.1 hypothetical protein [Methylophaga sp.]
MTIKQNGSTLIPASHKHHLCNVTEESLEIIEVRTGKYVGTKIRLCGLLMYIDVENSQQILIFYLNTFLRLSFANQKS